MNPTIISKDLTIEAPRSPHTILGGYSILARTIDKCRATIAGKNGEYHFDCPVDNTFFSFKGITGADFKAAVAEGKTDDEIVAWVNVNGTAKTPEEIAAWNIVVAADNLSAAAEKKAWLEGENVRLGLDKDATLFAFLDADDIASFKK